jgi:hypothetical protein
VLLLLVHNIRLLTLAPLLRLLLLLVPNCLLPKSVALVRRRLLLALGHYN